MNNEILNRLAGQQYDIYSVDEVIDERNTNNDLITQEERDQITPEMIHSRTPSGMPPHKLCLKIGAIVILLRNLFIDIGVCNGTRMIVKQIGLFNSIPIFK